MMSDKSKAAFPTLPIIRANGDNEWAGNGMTLREYATIHAPPPPEWWVKQQQASSDSPYAEKGIQGVLALWQVMMADALLAALKETSP
jgi:hypothetical protein